MHIVNAAVETRTFGVSSEEVGAIDNWVEQVGLRWGESERTVFRARLCIAELAANVASIESASERGRGLLLIHAYARDLSYCNDGTCNRVMLKVNSD
jgi:hypothetical protein